MSTQAQPRGIRNNNPGNLRWGDPWQGLVPVEERTDKDFCQFVTPSWGIRAMCVVLIAYQDKHNIRSVQGIISRWAPSVENDTQSYIQAVAASVGIPANTPTVNVHDYATLVELVTAIIMHENGVMPYSATQIDEGLKLAGVVKAVKSPVQTVTGASVATATASGAIAAAIEAQHQIVPVTAAITAAATGTADYAQYLNLIGAALVVLSLVAGAFAYWRHSRSVKATKQ